ncbi:unnamed protein product [Alternaria alternata]
MTDNKYSQRIPRRTWDMHKLTILRLYLSENRPLSAVKDMMHSEYGFSATKSQYETRLKKWSCYKYAAAHDRRTKVPARDNQRTEGLVVERHTRGPGSDTPTGSKGFRYFQMLHVIDHLHSSFSVTKHSDQDLFSTTLHSTSIFAKAPLPQLLVGLG